MHAPIPKTVNRIKEIRLSHKLTQKQVADGFNQFIAKNNLEIKPVSYASISRWESGETEPKESVWEALAGYFKVTTSYLRGYIHKEENDIEVNRASLLQTISKLKFSDDEDTDIDIHANFAINITNLFNTISDLNNEVAELHREIDTLNNPSIEEDPY